MLKIPYEKISKHSIWKIALILAEELESPNERKKHKACSKNKCEFSKNTVPTPDKSNDNLQQKCHSKENQKLCSFCGLKHRLGQAFCTSFGKKCTKCHKRNHSAKVCWSPEKMKVKTEECITEAIKDDVTENSCTSSKDQESQESEIRIKLEPNEVYKTWWEKREEAKKVAESSIKEAPKRSLKGTENSTHVESLDYQQKSIAKFKEKHVDHKENWSIKRKRNQLYKKKGNWRQSEEDRIYPGCIIEPTRKGVHFKWQFPW